MLTSAQALRAWEEVIALLREAQDNAAAHPGQPQPATFLLRLADTLAKTSRELASPHSAWKMLLQKKVPLTMFTACCELLPVCSTSAMCTAEMLLQGAAAGLQSSSASSGSSTSSGSTKLTALLWAQLEQSGFLQQLPGLFSSTIQALQARSPAPAAGDGGGSSPTDVPQLLNVLTRIDRLRPSWLTTSPAVQQCLVPAMQLTMLALQHLSKAVAAGAQGSYEGWPGTIWNSVNCASGAFAALFDTHLEQEQQQLAERRSRGFLENLLAAASGSSRAGPSIEVAAVLDAEQTTQFCCLAAVTQLLAYWLELKAQTDAAGSASAGQQWLPAVLAPSMPAAYSTMLEQLGCSREVGLWLATAVRASITDGSAAQGASRAALSRAAQREVLAQLEGYALIALQHYFKVVQAMDSVEMVPPQRLAAMQLCMPAAALQWLLDVPPDRLLAIMRWCSDPVCVAMSAITDILCKDGTVLIEMHCEQPRQQRHDTADWAAVWSVNQSIVSLCSAVLDKLVGMCRASPDSAAPSTAGSSGSSAASGTGGSGRRGSSLSVGDRDALLQSCRHLVSGLACGLDTAVTVTAAWGAGPLQLPGGRAQLCALLQEFLRLATAAGAAAAAAPTQAAAAGKELSEVLGAFHMLLYDLLDSNDVWDNGGPLVAPVAAAGDVSSPDALAIFGVLCTLLKFFSNPTLLAALLVSREGGVMLVMISTAVSVAVGALLRAAAQSTATVGSNPGSIGSSSIGNCSAALPWLVLLGHCCFACAVLVQHKHGMLQSDASGSYWRAEWLSQQRDLARNLQHLQPSLASAAQWLSAAGPAQQLAALGYQPQELQQRLAKAAAALAPVSSQLEAANPFNADGPGPHIALSTLDTVSKQLQAAGRALTCFAIPHACNNPACANVSGPSEAQLVGGRSCICAGCRTARYCGKACQRQAWRQHKPVCKALAAAAAAAAAAASPAAAAVPAASSAASESRAAV